MYSKEKPDYIKFLKDNDILEKFKYNLNNLSGTSLTDYIKTFYEKEGLATVELNFITSAFMFDKTPEGVDFWGEIYNKWLIYYKENKQCV